MRITNQLITKTERSMKTIEVKLTIDVQDHGQVSAFTALMAAMAGAATAVSAFANAVPSECLPPEAVVKHDTLNPAPAQETEKPKAKKEKPVKAEAKETTPAPPAQEPEQAPEEESDIKIEDVRALLTKKVENNRVGIRAKLMAYGVPNVTALAKEKYAEFYTYLEGLK